MFPAFIFRVAHSKGALQSRACAMNVVYGE